VRLASSNSLNRALASCTGQRFVSLFRGTESSPELVIELVSTHHNSMIGRLNPQMTQMHEIWIAFICVTSA
jgi:hypothetical protein